MANSAQSEIGLRSVRSDFPKPEVQMVTQSRFFVSEFNTAIIDGPLRIYFADKQEPQALQIYFTIQEALAELGLGLDTGSFDVSHTFVMLYPSTKEFNSVFSSATEYATDYFGKHLVIGVDLCKDFQCQIAPIVEKVKHALEAALPA